jgi:hypothetical protein
MSLRDHRRFTMVHTPSRRALLAGLGAGVAAAFAGCSSSEIDSSPPDDGTLVTDYAAAITRSTGERPPVIAPHEDTGGAENDDETSTTPEPLILHVIESERDAAELEFAAEATNVAAVRQLVAETAYANESVCVYQTRVGECHRLKVNYVTRAADGDPGVDVCRVIRDAHIACERRVYDRAAVFVRLPFPGDEYDGFSASSGGSCDPIPERYRNGSESS